MKRFLIAAIAMMVGAVALADTFTDAINAYRGKEYDKAYKMFEQLNIANKNDVQTLGYLGATSNRLGKPEQALGWLTEAMERIVDEADRDDADETDLENTFAWVGYEMQLSCKLVGDTVSAMKVLDEMLEAIPDNVDILEERATTLIQAGCYDQGRAALRDLIARDIDAETKEYCRGLLSDLGELPGKREWTDGKLIDLPTASAPAEPEGEVVYASFPGGMSALRQEVDKRLKWPKEALKARQACKVIVAAHITADGTVDEVSIAQPGLCKEQDAEAMRVVKALPKFNPATIGGTPVAATVQVPVNFVLPE